MKNDIPKAYAEALKAGKVEFATFDRPKANRRMEDLEEEFLLSLTERQKKLYFEFLRLKNKSDHGK
ncbi:MAG: hypothetical protein ABSA76_06770 [Bacteroidales bacterium]